MIMVMLAALQVFDQLGNGKNANHDYDRNSAIWKKRNRHV